MDKLVYDLYLIPGFAAAMLGVLILNQMPDRCFCDYDETPDTRHAAPRFFYRTHGVVCGVVLTVSFIFLQLRFGFSLNMAALCFFCIVLLMIALSDMKFAIIPDELVITGGIIAVIAALPDAFTAANWPERLSGLLGCAVGAGVILLINLLGRTIYGKDALGMGDLKLMAVCGIACGVSGVITALLIGIVAAGFWFALAMALNRLRADEYSPLGPFLVFGTIFALCFQPAVNTAAAWYLSLL